MATVGKTLADELVARNGYYSDDRRVVRIVEYTNAWGEQAFGIEYDGEIGKYSPSEYVNNPRVYWQAQD